MATTDARFIAAAPSLQMCFRDKDTGLPLRSGVAKFFKDQARSVPKDVYKLSGTPGNYEFTNIGNEIKLTGIGTFSDNVSPNAADIIPYFFPYEGTPDDSDGTVELYFVQVYSAGSAVLQFTRESWPPNIADDDTSEDNLVNYIPNGQFLLHTNLPETDTYDAGEVRDDVTVIAQGGWTFERPSGSTATDFVTFERFGSYVTNPTSSPRYAVRIRCTDPGSGGDFKDLRIKWSDVNKFASDEQKYTFYVSGITNAGGTLNVGLWAIKNFGTGGSAQEEKEIATFSFDNSYDIYKAAFVLGSNLNKTIGTLDDDFTQLAIRFPTDEIFDSTITDVGFTIGDRNVTIFPITPDADFKYKSLAGGITTPNYDSANLYLPILNGPDGFVYDTSVISKVRISSSDDIDDRVELKGDGSQYPTDGYSSHGVPYSRLQSKYWNSTFLVPKYGTGAEYAMAVLRTGSNIFGLHANTAGSVTATADGSAATGFTFETVATGAATYYTQAAWLANTSLLLQNLNRGAVTAATVNTSGFTISQQRVGSSILQEITSITCVAASALATPGNPAKYFKFFSYNAGAQEFYVWYQITNETDPAGGGTGIKIKLDAADTAEIVAQKTANVLNGWQTSVITTTAASAITAGSFWTFNSTAEGYYVWYKKDGAGSDPAPVGRTGIQVDIVTADTNILVASKTITAINQKYFAVPNYNGMYLQGIDPDQIIDKDARWSLVDNIAGMVLGTFQYDGNLSHLHGADSGGTFITDNVPGGLDVPGGGSLTDQREFTAYSGTYNTRPRNAVVNFYIRY